jgi:hypothetical protein
MAGELRFEAKIYVLHSIQTVSQVSQASVGYFPVGEAAEA